MSDRQSWTDRRGKIRAFNPNLTNGEIEEILKGEEKMTEPHKLSEWAKTWLYEKFDVDIGHSAYHELIPKLEALGAELQQLREQLEFKEHVIKDCNKSNAYWEARAESAEKAVAGLQGALDLCIADKKAAESEVKRLTEAHAMRDKTDIAVWQLKNDAEKKLSEARKLVEKWRNPYSLRDAKDCADELEKVLDYE